MISRRRFLQSSLSLALVPLLPRVAAATSVRIRPSWAAFCAGPQFATFVNAVKAMKAKVNSADPNSWAYWVNVHSQYCPHGRAYFLAWHRGFLYSFEKQLQLVSGDPELVLPYWNYYDTPTVPAEFLDPTSPLYRGDRKGTNVASGLSLDPFADDVLYFQRGKPNAFESIIEPRPHNNIHNLIGGSMASIRISPRDPLFFVHHANIDRLWVAWLNAGNGRRQPATIYNYWSGEFGYGAAISSVPRAWTASTDAYLGYQYDDITMPTALPTSAARLVAASSLSGALPTRPATTQSVPLGASRALVLDERSVSVTVPLSAQDANRVRSLMLAADAPAADTSDAASTTPLRVVLDDVRLTGLGQKGGYFYNVYVNLPASGSGSAPASAYLLGSVGPFEIGVAQMKASMRGAGTHAMAMDGHAAATGTRLVFPMTEALRLVWPASLDQLTISFVRVDGSRHPTAGDVIRIGAFSVQAASP